MVRSTFHPLAGAVERSPNMYASVWEQCASGEGLLGRGLRSADVTKILVSVCVHVADVVITV